MLQVYRLTEFGHMFAGNPRLEDTPRGKIIKLLSHGAKDKNALLQASGANSYDLSFLVSKHLIAVSNGVEV